MADGSDKEIVLFVYVTCIDNILMQVFRIKSICIVSLIVLSAISDSASFLSILQVYDTQDSSKLRSEAIHKKHEHDGIREPSQLVRLIRDRSQQYHLSLFRSDIFPSQVRAHQFTSRHRNLLSRTSQRNNWRCTTDCDLPPTEVDDENDEIFEPIGFITTLLPVDLISLHASHNFLLHGSSDDVRREIDSATTLPSDSTHNESLSSLDIPVLSFSVIGDSIRVEFVPSQIEVNVNNHNSNNTCIAIDSTNDTETGNESTQLKSEVFLSATVSDNANDETNSSPSRAFDSNDSDSNYQQNENDDTPAKSTELSCIYEADMSDAISPWSPLPAMNLALILLVFVMLAIAALIRICKIVLIYAQTYPEYLFNWLDQECGRLFAEQRFPLVIRVLRWYIPQIRLFFGEHHIHTSALKHYLARGLIASGQMESGLNYLFQVLGNYLPYGEDLHVSQVYEDIGYVQYELKQYRAALQSLHATLRILSEEFACRSFVDQQMKKDPDWTNLSMSNIETSSCNVTPERVDRQHRDASLLDPTSAANAHMVGSAGSSNTMGAETSPSTMDLNEVFFAQTDLKSAMRDLEHFLGESAEDEEELGIAPSQEIKLFQDLQRIPTVDIARVCKKLGDVYSELAAWKDAHVFYCNALAVLQHLAHGGTEYPKAIEELRNSILLVSEKLKQQTHDKSQRPAALDYDSLTYQQFYFPSSSGINL